MKSKDIAENKLKKHGFKAVRHFMNTLRLAEVILKMTNYAL